MKCETSCRRTSDDEESRSRLNGVTPIKYAVVCTMAQDITLLCR
jgi:hypothetical protein